MYGLAGLDNDYLLQWRCIGKVGHNDVNIQNSPNYFKQIVNTQKICIKYSLNVNICLSIIVPRFCCKYFFLAFASQDKAEDRFQKLVITESPAGVRLVCFNQLKTVELIHFYSLSK